MMSEGHGHPTSESLKKLGISCAVETLDDEESLRKLIECPICLEIPLPPIYLCTKGHIVCNTCQSRTYTCPLCRERYCNTRCFLAEGLVESCKLRCRYADSGCDQVLKGCELQEHLNVCDFRPVKCRDCGDKPVSYMEYENHLFKYHNICGTNATEAFVAYRINLNFMQRSLYTCFWPLYYIKAFDKIFLLRLSAHQFTLNPWICLLGSPQECAQYFATIEYEPANDGTILHSWRGPVNHFRDDPLDVISQGKALTVGVDTILEAGAISLERAEWIYHIVLSKKDDDSNGKLTEEATKAAVSLGASPKGTLATTVRATPDAQVNSENESLVSPVQTPISRGLGDRQPAAGPSSVSCVREAEVSSLATTLTSITVTAKSPNISVRESERVTSSRAGDIEDASDWDL